MATVELLERDRMQDIINDGPEIRLAQELESIVEDAKQPPGCGAAEGPTLVLQCAFRRRPLLLVLTRPVDADFYSNAQQMKNGGKIMLQRREPFNDLRQMQSTMDQMWRRFGNHQSNGSPEIEAWGLSLGCGTQGR